jgi:hypothetical protein
MRSGDLDGADWIAEWTSTDSLELELQELVEEAHARAIWRRLDVAAIIVVLALVALSVYAIGWASG